MKEVLKKLGKTLSKKSPTILMILGTTGGVSTVIMAIKATPKAVSLLEEERWERDHDDGRVDMPVKPLTKVDIVKLTWKCYLPAVIMGTVTVMCFAGANSINGRRRAALASAYALSEAALKEYKGKIVETFGEKEALKIRDSISNDKMQKVKKEDSTIIFTGGDTLCFDTLSGRYFKSDIEKIKRTINERNSALFSSMWCSVNELYLELGLDPIRLGDDTGWEVNSGLIDPDFSSQLTEDGKPCLVLDFSTRPKYDYRD